MALASLDMLRNAITARLPVMLAFTIDGRTLCFPATFLADEADTFWVCEPPEIGPFADLLIRGKVALTMAFRSDQSHVMLTTILLARGQQDGLPALKIAYPAELEAMHQRLYYRVHVPGNSGLEVRVWKMNLGDSLKQLPKPSAELTALTCDLSVGGMKALLVPRLGAPPVVDERNRLRIQLKHEGQELLIEAKIRSLRKDLLSGGLIAGLQFISTTQDLKWHQACQRIEMIVAHLQRQELHLLWDRLEHQTAQPAA